MVASDAGYGYGHRGIASQQLLVRLPEDLFRRLKLRVPARERSRFVGPLLEQALPADDDANGPLYLAAVAAEMRAVETDLHAVLDLVR